MATLEEVSRTSWAGWGIVSCSILPGHIATFLVTILCELRLTVHRHLQQKIKTLLKHDSTIFKTRFKKYIQQSIKINTFKDVECNKGIITL